ncbi:PH domain-containing protein [Rhodococcus hoagii]|uniref:PH domain-containing protein n=1 Tax=Rhodococcus hoagii TaxID=43767 RepID=UPI0019667EC7|nr:PH domain-containing protein [Prescottella equi]MBM9835125.1 PH domain-containing protein [Prescottella equi]NKV28397.1 PH domain-containing protein [Prescottella equi]
MGYPEDALAADEELVLHRHPHWKMLVVPVTIFVLSAAIGGYLLGLAQRRLSDGASLVASAVIVVAWLALVVWKTLVPVLRWRSTHFIVTDRRVMIRHGIMTHTGIDIPMNRISNVQFRHGLVDRMLRTGTLMIVASSDDPLEFDDIPEVQKVHSLLYRQVFDATNDPYSGGYPNTGHDGRGAAPDDHRDFRNGW